MARPKRVVGISYTGPNAYFVTTCTRDRLTCFNDIDFGRSVVAALFDHSTRHRFAVSAYCLMPDHAHLLLSGQDESAALHPLIKAWKQSTGFAWSRGGRGRLWQEGYWERIVRDDEAVRSVARYVVENPVRAHLVERVADYPLVGSGEFTLDAICAAVQLMPGWRN